MVNGQYRPVLKLPSLVSNVNLQPGCKLNSIAVRTQIAVKVFHLACDIQFCSGIFAKIFFD
jgi:hypothetical protein